MENYITLNISVMCFYANVPTLHYYQSDNIVTKPKELIMGHLGEIASVNTVQFTSALSVLQINFLL